MAVFTSDLNTTVKPTNVRVPLTSNNMSTRDEFQRWMAEGNARKYPPEVALACMDRISEYAVCKKITAGSLWEHVKHSTFKLVYKRLLEMKMLRITDRNTYKVFIVAGRLYMQFLKEKSHVYKGAIPTLSNVPEEKLSVMPGQKVKHTINTENVVAWLVTQPNANGTLYLETVVRQYMSALRTAPEKLDMPIATEVKSIFDCQTTDELNTYWEVFRSAPNYQQVNSSTSGMFSAALNCYLRYLQHLADSVQVDESIKMYDVQPVVQGTVAACERQKPDVLKCVDFDYPERCAQTKPVRCTINGEDIVPKKRNWSQLLIAITESFISEKNLNLASLDHISVYGSRVFFLSQKTDFGNCAKLSNGKWIYANYNPQTVVTIIGNLCSHCGVNLDDVIINIESKDDKAAVPIQTLTHHAYLSQTEMPHIDFKHSIIEQLTGVLLMHYTNGFRLNSPIEMTRFRLFAAKDLDEELMLGDEELMSYIEACGTTYDGKVYVVSAAVKERIQKLVDSYLAEGAQSIFFAEFYTKNEDWLFEASVVSEHMLIVVLREILPNLSFTQTYCGYTSVSVFTVLEEEILRVWGGDVLLTYSQISERLPYIPLERIKQGLGQNGDFIWNSTETFTHISRIEITDNEREDVRITAVKECSARGYASVTDLPYCEIEERNYELSITAVHNAIYRICLSDTFDKRGKIITRKGDVFDALTIMKEYCRTIDKCMLDELLNYERELTGEVHRWIPMEAGNAILVRIDKENYVSDKFVCFDSEVIDDAIGLIVTGDYLPLKSFTTFGAFPDCGQTWNLFLLESYCRRFSRRFRFDAPSVNSRNAGAIIRKSCVLDYTQVMIDAVANSDILLTKANVGIFLYKSGYTGKSTTAQAPEIIEKAQAIRERRD